MALNNYNSVKKLLMTNSTDKQKKEHKGTKNLIHFKKGVSGNLKGRPKKKKCIPDILNRIGDELVIITKGDNKGHTVPKRDFILQGVYEKAMKGDQWSIQFIADRTEGRPIQPTADVSEEWKKLFEECGFEKT